MRCLICVSITQDLSHVPLRSWRPWIGKPDFKETWAAIVFTPDWQIHRLLFPPLALSLMWCPSGLWEHSEGFRVPLSSTSGFHWKYCWKASGKLQNAFRGPLEVMRGRLGLARQAVVVLEGGWQWLMGCPPWCWGICAPTGPSHQIPLYLGVSSIELSET